MNDLIEDILDWGEARGLHEADLRPQLVKLIEELGEIAAGVARSDPDQIVDGVGDLLVVLINFGACYAKQIYPNDIEEQLRMERYFLEICLRAAYKEIKDRQGRTVDGVFVKND